MRHLNTPSLAIARQSLTDAMTRVGWPPSAISDAELALVELIVNAWRHGGTAAPVVNILAVNRTLRVSVADESRALPERRALSELAEYGRGLQLVEGLTHRWGVDPQKRGKLVWFEMDAA
ncbi:ATP-binding protein [Streptomyces kaniharaensis]|uniref:ATP-binding protein n=1 Tax=Streptomyces kaniharaensis TaxID=212423 RepID=A0A6N7KT93_9ACTN|nr:ATP-binding protein [Streptomyces kaniharaensis]MQS12823.1 ATP-binding protein [Streptomyces kaniharaensis]